MADSAEKIDRIADDVTVDHPTVDNTSPEERLVSELIRRGFHISFAESCTAGLAAGTLVNVPDASRVLNGSFVTYSNEAKIRYVDVRPKTLARFGAVSEQVAAEMAKGAAAAMAAEVGVGISGIAGPAGGTSEKPVGTVCFGYAVCGALTTETVRFPQKGRQEVRKAAVQHALQRVYGLLRAGEG